MSNWFIGERIRPQTRHKDTKAVRCSSMFMATVGSEAVHIVQKLVIETPIYKSVSAKYGKKTSALLKTKDKTRVNFHLPSRYSVLPRDSFLPEKGTKNPQIQLTSK